jgi:hypothetical protein
MHRKGENSETQTHDAENSFGTIPYHGTDAGTTGMCKDNTG